MIWMLKVIILFSLLFTVLPSLICVMFICLLKKSDCFSLCLQLQIKHAVTQAEIQLLKRKVSLFNTHLHTCRQKSLKTAAHSGCTAEENAHMHNTSSFWLYDDLMPPTYHLLLPHTDPHPTSSWLTQSRISCVGGWSVLSWSKISGTVKRGWKNLRATGWRHSLYVR